MAEETTLEEVSQMSDEEFFGVSPDGGKVDDDTPATGQETVTEEKAGEEGKTDGEPAVEAQAPVVSDEDLESALSPEESPAEKAARLERDYSASSKEAKRLNGERKALESALAGQGLKLIVKDGKADLIATEKYSSDGKPFEANISLKDISVSDLESLESGDIAEIQKVFDKLAGRIVEDANRKLVRAAPTREKEAPVLSEERKATAFSHLAEAKDEFDMPKHENFEQNSKHIEAFINNPARPQVIRDAFAEAPELVAALVNSYINGVREGVIKRGEAAKAAKEQKEKEAREKAGAGITDEGTVSKAGASDDFLNSVGRTRFS